MRIAFSQHYYYYFLPFFLFYFFIFSVDLLKTFLGVYLACVVMNRVLN